MKKNKKYKMIIILSIILFIVTITLSSFGFNPNDYKPKNMAGGARLVKIANVIIGAVQLVGSGISVIAIIIIGIKYMMGSVEEKAEYKKTMIPYVVGCIMVFWISNIVKIIYNIAVKIG